MGLRRTLAGVVFCAGLVMPCWCVAEKWPGVDEAVVKRIAREQGREEARPLLPQAEGDLQLFLFLLAGAVGGFAAGYCWRMLMEGKRDRRE